MGREGVERQVGRFAFGLNWAAYASKVGEAEIAQAVAGLRRLLGGRGLAGARVLDIGCGSGIHSVAALRLGAACVVAVDVDANAVATATAVLKRWAPGTEWRVEQADVLEMSAAGWGRFELVYAWGVLHHTGDLRRAMRSAALLVEPGGLYAVALYRRTWMCPFWEVVKRWYAGASPGAQAVVRAIYVKFFGLDLRVTGRRLENYAREYLSNRGMHFEQDVHDWLGGYPYESISAREVDRLMRGMGFVQERAFVRRGKLLGRDLGLFGSGCDEYLYVRAGG